MIKGYIDRGHGEGGDPGAGTVPFIERDINIKVGEHITGRLRDLGFEILVEPGNLTIGDSARAANNFGANFLISIHCNAGGGDRGEIIHSIRSGSLELANAVAVGMKAAGQSEVRIYNRINDQGYDYFGILRVSVMPAIIVELFFVDNYIDRQIGDTDAELQNIGICIANSIAQYYGIIDYTEYKNAVMKFAAAGIISGPDFWINSVVNGSLIEGKWVGVLLQKISGKSTLNEAIQFFVDNKIINSPNYWLENCAVGKTVNPSYVKVLFIATVNKLQIGG